ncbi:MAG: hypothetical protein CMN28_13630 [Salinisphaeraceae bacterium]|nr:hypothetical protein [Salinisphaeraceae bacterium]
MQAGNLKELYVQALQDMYSGECMLVEALPEMASNAEHADLKTAFDDHLEETKTQIKRLEGIFGELGQSPNGVKCAGIEALTKEGEAIMSAGPSNVRDAAMIAVAQRVEHYEIATYGSLCTYAELLDRRGDLDKLKETLSEEKEADGKLNSIAKEVVNPAAAA